MTRRTKFASGQNDPLPDVQPQGRAFAGRLLRWFRHHRRDFPWRRTGDPYRIWISEVMLQQTRAETVVPYYERFVRRFPDLPSLACADSAAVLKAWEGLGYYRRAHHLKQAAERLTNSGADQLPDDYQSLLKLPGIGRYTAGAVMSLAFNRPYPIQDGNVRRVLCRVWAINEDPKTPAVQHWLWASAESLLPKRRAGEFNEALMELGATVCTARRPRCADCPLSELCQARELGRPLAYPRKRKPRTLPHVQVTAGIIRRGHRILIARRPTSSMLGGLWEFPGGKQEPGESLEQCLVREIAEELAITIRIERPFVQVDHAYSHFRMTLHSFLCRHSRGRPQAIGCAQCRWVSPNELEQFAFPKADRVILAALLRSLDD